MRRFALPLALLALVPLAAQKRHRKPKPQDFPTTIKSAVDAWNAKRFAVCLKKLREAEGITFDALEQAVIAALPEIPGYKKRPLKKKKEDMRLMHAMGLGGFRAIEQYYDAENGGGTGKISIQADSPLIKMFAGMLQMAQFDEDNEVVEYGSHKALFKNKGDSPFELQILLYNKHLVSVEWPRMDEDAFFKIFDQAFVDKLAGLLGD